MGYDLRRLKRKCLIQPVGRKLCYSLTPRGRRGALYFLTKVQAHILPPGLQALDLRITSEAPAPTYGLHHPLIKPFNNLPTSTSARLPLYFTSKMSTTTSPVPEFFAECSLASCHIACPAFISTSKLREPDVNVTLQSLMG